MKTKKVITKIKKERKNLAEGIAEIIFRIYNYFFPEDKQNKTLTNNEKEN